jgi:hypothetical protein
MAARSAWRSFQRLRNFAFPQFFAVISALKFTMLRDEAGSKLVTANGSERKSL